MKLGPDEAEDLTQQVFIKLLEHQHHHRGESSLFTWIYRITQNAVIDELRKRQIRKDAGEMLPYTHPTICTDFTNDIELRLDLSEALSVFNQLDREIIALRFFVDCTLAEIAEIVGMKESAVKNRLYRMLGRLRNEFEHWKGAQPMSAQELITLVRTFEIQGYAIKEKEAEERIVSVLQERLAKISEHLQCKMEKKVVIELYSSVGALRREANKPDAPDWFVAYLSKDCTTIKSVTPLNPGPKHSDTSVSEAILTLFATAVALQINQELPIWLKVGIGSYEAGRMWGNVRELHTTQTLPSLDDLNHDWDSFSDNNGYMYAFTIVAYIVEKFGYAKLVGFIKQPDAYETLFGCDKMQFESNWKEYALGIIG